MITYIAYFAVPSSLALLIAFVAAVREAEELRGRLNVPIVSRIPSRHWPEITQIAVFHGKVIKQPELVHATNCPDCVRIHGFHVDREHRILPLETNNRDLQIRLAMCQTEPCPVSSKLT